MRRKSGHGLQARGEIYGRNPSTRFGDSDVLVESNIAQVRISRLHPPHRLPCTQGSRISSTPSTIGPTLPSPGAKFRTRSTTSRQGQMDVSPEFLARVQQYEEMMTNVPGTFANESFKSRLPGLVRDCVADNRERFSSDQKNRLLQLAEAMIDDAGIPLPSQYLEQVTKSSTSAHWETLLKGKGYTWQNGPWFLVEQYMFHLVLLLAEYYTTGLDPFHPSKVAELKEVTPWVLLQTAVSLSARNEEVRSQTRYGQLERLIKLCLWGNKADGCYKEVKDTITATNVSFAFDDELLLVDHTNDVMNFLDQKARETGDAKSVSVQFINDNSGAELLLDLALADHLLDRGWCGKVTLNVKVEPMYVSDATPADVHEHIAEMQRETRTPEVQALGKRLATHVENDKLVIHSDIFWNRYAYYWDMPLELQTRFAREATLVIIKGDLNYRRLLGDRLWPPSTPIEDAVPYFPTAFVSFRTLKSNPVVGIPADVVAKLEKEDPKWRYNGKRGTIQGVLGADIVAEKATRAVHVECDRSGE